MKIPCDPSCRDYVASEIPFCGYLCRPAGEVCMVPDRIRKRHCETCRQRCKHDLCPWWGGEKNG